MRDLRHLRARRTSPGSASTICASPAQRPHPVDDPVFAPDGPGHPGPRIHNDQLVRYAGHRMPSGEIRGDGRYTDFTDRVLAGGWAPPEPRGRFDVLPLLISDGGEPELFEVPPDAVLEVDLLHPALEWFTELRLRWHAVPAISNMPLRIGGITYPAAPFNGWYLNTEIGARNLADTDRYNLLPVIAARMGSTPAARARCGRTARWSSS